MEKRERERGVDFSFFQVCKKMARRSISMVLPWCFIMATPVARLSV
jgi:hypothetical protein